MVGPWGQLIEGRDAASIAALALLEGLLSADNALILAIMVKHLPKDRQTKALTYGLGGAFVFRLIAIVFATFVLRQWWLQAIGAAYLVFVTARHFIANSSKKKVAAKPRRFWSTVLFVEITDIAFAVDSVLAGIAFVGNRPQKIWVVFFGATVGIILLRFAAGAFVKLMEKYPSLDHVAYLLVGWVGIKLAFISANTWSSLHPDNPYIAKVPPHLFWPILLGIAIIGGFFAIQKGSGLPSKNADSNVQNEDKN